MRVEIAPSILSADLTTLTALFPEMIGAGVRRLHVDVMDGQFVPNLTFGSLVLRPFLKAWPGMADVHLMVLDPQVHVDAFLSCGAAGLTFHLESSLRLRDLLERVRRAGAMAGLSLRPGTPLGALVPWLPLVDLVLVMTVEPGSGGQPILSDMISRISEIRDLRASLGLDFAIHADGGIKLDNLALMADHGVDVAVVGSAFFECGLSPAEFMRRAEAAAPGVVPRHG